MMFAVGEEPVVVHVITYLSSGAINRIHEALEDDEIALSHNTIDVKGFALALQLVMVEAVPCLNEVIQETCSSSEGDSKEDVEEKSGKPKRKTLSPGHARNIDKQSDVLVRSIIDEDPLRPVDESEFVWSDEEDDEKVDHTVFLINNNFNFTKSMFVGGVSKLDVDRMRAAENVSSKLKKPKKQPAFSMSNDPGYIASIVIQNVKPQLQTMEGNILRASTRLDSIEGSLLGLVKSVFAKFKEEMLESVRCLVAEFTKGDEVGPSRIPEKGNQTPSINKGNMAGSNVSHVRDANAQSIRNILANLSAYSTPPASPRLSLEVENRGQANHFDMPSFSLGLTQEERLDVAAGISPTEFVGLIPCPIVSVGEKSDDPQNSRKSKRQKCVPQALVDDYQCDPDIVSRVRKSQKFIFAFDESKEIDMKYERLGEEVKGAGLIKIGGVAVILDCNTSFYSDVMMEKHLHPHLAMIPHLLRLSGHALPACKYINSNILAEEGKSAAIMAFELQEIV
ncbi:hypothetical protein Bca101_057435 [Brassica carinata]